jgi:nitrate/TMAO reductase-like tetraheme cytochrome c subunit
MSTEKPTYLSALVSLFGRNWITLMGGMLAGSSGFLIVCFLLAGFLHLTDSPYIGIMAFLVLPAVFVTGLLIVPAGAYWERKRRPGAAAPDKLFPIVDLNHPHTRRVAALVVILTAVNLMIVGTVSYQGVHFMDSVTFCGKVCHTVMEPEFTAYSTSPHLRVPCVECHIGPGANWFVRSKISGTGQLLAVAFNTYPTPIPSPVENLRPSRDTCEQCHWPEKFTGDRVKILTHFQEDEANTQSKSVLLMHIGGGEATKGIHSWHISQDKRTYYTAVDEKRQKIAQVRVVHQDGSEETFRAPEGAYTPEELAGSTERMMDCIDCHNRPSHIFKMPVQELDAALAAGRLDPALPYIKKVGMEALSAAEGTPEDLEQLEKTVRAYYEQDYADLAKSSPERIDAAIGELKAIYSRNVFPKMKLTWGTHPDNLGHELFPGCFRCHDDSLQDGGGKTVGQDCEICHKVLAWDEPNPEILVNLGL